MAKANKASKKVKASKVSKATEAEQATAEVVDIKKSTKKAVKQKAEKVDAKTEKPEATDKPVKKVPAKKAPAKAKGTAVAKKGKKVAKKKHTGRSLKVLGNLINNKITSSAKTAIDIGSLLQEGKGWFGKTADWLAWTEDNFGFKKAHHYNYVKVALVFGSEEMKAVFGEFKIDVLSSLTRDDKMLDEAISVIKKGGEVNGAWVSEYRATKREEEKQARLEAGELSKEDKKEIADQKRAEKEASQQKAEELYVKELEQKLEVAEAEVATVKLTAMGEYFAKLAIHLGKLKPHQVLNIEADANKRAINKAKRALEVMYAPKNGGDEAVMAVINKAVSDMA